MAEVQWHRIKMALERGMDRPCVTPRWVTIYEASCAVTKSSKVRERFYDCDRDIWKQKHMLRVESLQFVSKGGKKKRAFRVSCRIETLLTSDSHD